MNKLKGKIINIESSDSISLVEMDAGGDIFSCVLLETADSASYLKIGRQVTLLFKETEVSIGKNLSGMISLRNRITSRIKKIEKSKILTKITLDYRGEEITSIISTKSAERLSLAQGDDVEWLVKANEISLSA